MSGTVLQEKPASAFTNTKFMADAAVKAERARIVVDAIALATTAMGKISDLETERSSPACDSEARTKLWNEKAKVAGEAVDEIYGFITGKGIGKEELNGIETQVIGLASVGIAVGGYGWLLARPQEFHKFVSKKWKLLSTDAQKRLLWDLREHAANNGDRVLLHKMEAEYGKPSTVKDEVKALRKEDKESYTPRHYSLEGPPPKKERDLYYGATLTASDAEKLLAASTATPATVNGKVRPAANYTKDRKAAEARKVELETKLETVKNPQRDLLLEYMGLVELTTGFSFMPTEKNEKRFMAVCYNEWDVINRAKGTDTPYAELVREYMRRGR